MKNELPNRAKAASGIAGVTAHCVHPPPHHVSTTYRHRSLARSLTNLEPQLARHINCRPYSNATSRSRHSSISNGDDLARRQHQR